MNQNLITKSNKAIEASYKLTLNEQRVLLSCISLIDSRTKITTKIEFKIKVKDFSETFNLPHGSTYTQMAEGANRLTERTFRVRSEDNKLSSKINWTSKTVYNEKEGEVSIFFGEYALPYLSNISETFTSYRLQNISQLTSIYAIRLYEMLTQWKKVGKVEFSLESFRESLAIEKNEYKRMFDFKKHVLNIAVDQINEHTDINCRYKEIKKGRKITGFIFHFGKDALTQIELEDVIADAKNHVSD